MHHDTRVDREAQGALRCVGVGLRHPGAARAVGFTGPLLALPVIDSLRLRGPRVLSVTAQIAVADTACIVLLPLVIDIRRLPTSALGALAVTGCAVVLFVVLRAVDRRNPGAGARMSTPRSGGSRWN